MGFFQSSYRARLPLRAGGPIFAVGRRVYVGSPAGRPARLTSTDDGAGDALTSLVDGTEVEILGWRPRSSGTLYRVRSTRVGVEGWLAAGSVYCPEPTVAPTGPRSAGADRTRAKLSAISPSRANTRPRPSIPRPPSLRRAR
jgi:hypothetical protein